MVDCASHTYACPQNLLHCSLQLPRTAAVPHDPRNLDDLLHLQIAAVLDVLLLQSGALQFSYRLYGMYIEGMGIRILSSVQITAVRNAS